MVLPARVLMTADTVGGVWNYALELTTALTQRGVKVGLATMGAPLTTQQWQAVGRSPQLQVFESDFRLEWMPDPWVDVQRAGEWLLELAERWQPEIVHLNSYVHGALPWQVPVLLVGHSCVLSWWEAVKHEAAPLGWQRYRQEVQRGLQAASLVVAPSATMLASLQRHYQVSGRVIFNGRAAAGLKPGRKQELILTVGRLWDQAKNVAVLEQIAPEVKWAIYLAGEDEPPRRGERQERREERGSPVRLGFLAAEELAGWYERAAIYVLPARYEPFGLSVLEAALSGCALVLGNIPSLQELWGEVAMFVPPEDEQAIATAINCLILDDARRVALAVKARQRALEFTPQRMVSGYLQAYQDLIHGRVKR